MVTAWPHFMVALRCNKPGAFDLGMSLALQQSQAQIGFDRYGAGAAH